METLIKHHISNRKGELETRYHDLNAPIGKFAIEFEIGNKIRQDKVIAAIELNFEWLDLLLKRSLSCSDAL